MGSPVSVAVAKLVMEDVEDQALEALNIQLPFWMTLARWFREIECRIC